MDKKLNINESFICKIWEGANEYLTPLKTVDGDSVEIIDFGKKNFDSGPDYLDAKIKIGSKIFRGHVEIHRDFKHWFEHRHHDNRKYVPLILHVVMWESVRYRKLVKVRINRDIPSVILANHLKYSIHFVWQDIINKPSAKTQLQCVNLNDRVKDSLIQKWFSALALERLKLKSKRIVERLLELEKESGKEPAVNYLRNKSHWEQVFYELVFEALGFSKNKEQMLKLAKSYRLNDVRNTLKLSSSVIDIQAALFGLSGLFFDVRIKNEYLNKIKELWGWYEPAIKSERLFKADWNFFRLRPQNFPPRRIAYGSQFIIKLLKEDLLKEIILLFQNNELEPKEIYKYLSSFLKPGNDEYWNSHYNFGKKSAKPERLLGAQRIDDIIVNVITPFVYLYAGVFAKNNLKDRVIDFYTKLKTNPDNSIVRLIQSQAIKKRDININTPAMEQAAIQLYNFYCVRERCKECDIGKMVFKDSGYEYKIIFY